MAKLTHEEELYIASIKTELDFYNEYKEIMADIKTAWFKSGAEGAKQMAVSKADELVQLACDSLFSSVFDNLQGE